jgi:RNA polymerase sigma-70 factor (ECF subfamily)
VGPIIYRRCLSLLRDREQARDATQEVFVKLVGTRRLNDREHAAAWIYRAATRHCLNLLRDADRRDGKLRQVALEVGPAVTADTYPARELAQRVLSEFDESVSAIAVGVLVDGIEQGELAEILGISRRTVARKLAAFLSKARRMVEGGSS